MYNEGEQTDMSEQKKKPQPKKADRGRKKTDSTGREGAREDFDRLLKRASKPKDNN